jgi:hypothetical protein
MRRELHRRVGSEEIRHRQLMHFVEQGKRKHIGMQIVPASLGQASFRRFPRPGIRALAARTWAAS